MRVCGVLMDAPRSENYDDSFHWAVICAGYAASREDLSAQSEFSDSLFISAVRKNEVLSACCAPESLPRFKSPWDLIHSRNLSHVLRMAGAWPCRPQVRNSAKRRS